MFDADMAVMQRMTEALAGPRLRIAATFEDGRAVHGQASTLFRKEAST
jgi:hypothetical protein